MGVPANLIDWTRFGHARTALGSGFWATLVRLHDEGEQAVAAIEAALRRRDAIAMVEPAERLKSEADALGAVWVAEIAEDIEMGARDCVEWHQDPGHLIEPVVLLRTAFADTVAQLTRDTSPLKQRVQGAGPKLLAA